MFLLSSSLNSEEKAFSNLLFINIFLLFFLKKVVIYFVIFSLVFLVAKYFCCQKNSITEKELFALLLLSHSPIMDDFPMIKKSEGRKEKLSEGWKIFPAE